MSLLIFLPSAALAVVVSDPCAGYPQLTAQKVHTPPQYRRNECDEATKKRVNTKEIYATLPDTRTSPDTNDPLQSAGFNERFQRDGKWQGFRSEVALRRFDGRWTVENNLLCVSFQIGRRSCREVYILPTGAILLEDFTSPGERSFRFKLLSIKGEKFQ